jgi:hypothetical protein
MLYCHNTFLMNGDGMFQYRCAQSADAEFLARLQIEAEEVKAKKTYDSDFERQSKIKGAQTGIESVFTKGGEGLILSYNQKPVGYMLYYTENDTMHIEEFYAMRCEEAKKRVGRDMFSTAVKMKNNINSITVISSDYGQKFYDSLGMTEISNSLRLMEIGKQRLDIVRKTPKDQYPDFQSPATFMRYVA